MQVLQGVIGFKNCKHWCDPNQFQIRPTYKTHLLDLLNIIFQSSLWPIVVDSLCISCWSNNCMTSILVQSTSVLCIKVHEKSLTSSISCEASFYCVVRIFHELIYGAVPLFPGQAPKMSHSSVNCEQQSNKWSMTTAEQLQNTRHM